LTGFARSPGNTSTWTTASSTLALTEAPSLEQTVQAWHNAGHSQRAIARELNLDRRKVKRIIDQAA
jgi:DNA-binding transcriptional regulator LsrR (DeoR family)